MTRPEVVCVFSSVAAGVTVGVVADRRAYQDRAGAGETGQISAHYLPVAS